VNDIRTKNDKAEKFDTTAIDRLEATVVELNTRVESTLQETASLRNTTAAAASERRIKSSFEDMTSSRWPVDSSVWPPDFCAKPIFGSPKMRAQNTARIRKRDFIN
jgi:hypothetical protein